MKYEEEYRTIQDINELDNLQSGDRVFIPRGDHHVTVPAKDGQSDSSIKYLFGLSRLTDVKIKGERGTRIFTGANPAEISQDSLCLISIRHCSDIEISDIEIIGEGRQKFIEGENESWRGGFGIGFQFSERITLERVHARDFQTHFDFHVCSEVVMDSCRSSGIAIPALFRFRESKRFLVTHFRGTPDYDGFANPGQKQREEVDQANKFQTFSMGGWIVHGCEDGLICDYDVTGCAQEALVIEGERIKRIRCQKIRLGHSRWGFVMRGGSGCYINNMEIRNCWRCGLMLRGDHDHVVNNHFKNIRVHNCGRLRDDGVDDRESIHEGKNAHDNTFEDYSVTFDEQTPWPRPNAGVRLAGDP